MDSLRQEIDHARERYREARERVLLAIQDSLEARADSVPVGPLLIVARPQHMATGVDLFRKVWSEVEPYVGDSVRPLKAQPILFEAGDPEDRLFVNPAVNLRLTGFTRYFPGGPEGLARGAVAELMAGPLGARWGVRRLRTEPLRLDRDYRFLATAPSVSARRCLRGDAAECWVAMGLVEVQDPVLRWYTPQERRHVVRRFGGQNFARNPELYDACAHGGDDVACTAALGTRQQLGAPLAELKESLLAMAMKIGGEGAYERILEVVQRDGSLREALSEASGLEPDELAEAWVAELRSARPRYLADVRTAQWATVLWIVLFGGLAMRSTRWRLG